MVARARNVTAEGFEVAFFEQETLMDGHLPETVGYLAVWSPLSDGVVNIGGEEQPYLLQAVEADDRFTPVLSSSVKVEEEQSGDAETRHIDEGLDVLVLGDRLFAQDVTTRGADTAALRQRQADYATPMEWGVIDGVTGTWKLVPLRRSYTDPVVIAQISDRQGGDPGIVRIRNAGSDAFELRFQEWDYLDRLHSTGERVFYAVAERGTFSLAGLRVEAGYLDTRAMMETGPATVSLAGTFAATPAVFTSVMTEAGLDAVAVRVANISASGFSIGMQEQQANAPSHTTERIGWIAIETGTGTTSDGRSIEVATLTTDSNGMTYWMRQPTSQRFPVAISSLSSFKGADPATAAQSELAPSSVHVSIQEEQSLDAETWHKEETIAIFVAE